MDLEQITEEGADTQLDTDRNLSAISTQKEKLRKRLVQLNKALDEIHAEESDIVGNDMSELVAELGGDADLKDILDTILLSAEEISNVEKSISDVAAESDRLEAEGADFKARYGAERRVTKGMELILASQQNELDQERKKIRDMLENIREIKQGQRSEMQAGIEATLQTPMQSAAASIIKLIHQAEEEENFAVAVPLSKVLKQMTAANLYTPGFRFQDDVDTDTRRWIAETFSPKVSTREDAQVVQDVPARPPSPRVLSPAAADMPLLSFDQFRHPEEELTGLIQSAFEKFGLLEEFKVRDETFVAFVEAMREGYKSVEDGVTYHNFRHAFDVTQMAYFFITQTNAGEIMDNMDIFLLLLCCVGHDVDHNGLNNTFHENTQSPLAMLYNDTSIMENHHCSTTLKILAREECNLMANLTAEQQKANRNRIVNIILATDMTKHFDVTNKFKLKVEAGQFGVKGEDGNASAEDRDILLDLLMHASDLSNPVRPFPLAKKWGYDIMEEFCSQGDMEKKLGMPVSPLCERDDLTTDVQKAGSQIGFGDFVVGPMYKDMAAYFTGLEPCVESLAKNREYYSEVKEGKATMDEVIARAEAECAAAAATLADGGGEPAPAVESDDDSIDGDDV